MRRHRWLNLILLVSVIASLVLGGGGIASAQNGNPPDGSSPKLQQQAEMQQALQGPLPPSTKGNGQMRSMTVAQREAARFNQAPQQRWASQTFAGINPATAALSPLATQAMAAKAVAAQSAKAKQSLPQSLSTLATGPANLAAMSAPLAQPDVFGVGNWANSPLPTIGSTTTPPTIVNVTVGNPLVARAYSTDGNANALIVNPVASLPAGTLTAFQTYDEPGSGSNTFHAYVLRPTGTANQYTVAFDSGVLTAPAVATGGVQTFSVGPFAVLAGDRIAHYGQGIPIDIGTGTDILVWPTSAAPTQGSTITLGSASYPIYPQARTYSIAAVVSVAQGGTTGSLTGGMRKFVDTLPPLCTNTTTVNDLGQCLPLAVPDTTTFPGSDYYEIELGQYHEQMHADLPVTGTLIAGYRQTNAPAGSPALAFHYLGPVILAIKDRPVRVKFTNSLPTGAGGDLFIPTDTTYMGAGMGYNLATNQYDTYTQNRATLHLHGGNTPWISDGTPHQWTVPVGETATTLKKGDSAAYVPDMWFDATGAVIASCAGKLTCALAGASNNPGDGRLSFYWTNQESGRLMFYHDHAYGITRLDVYAGEAAGYLLADPAQETALRTATVPGTVPSVATADLAHLVPLVIQDRTFVPDNGAPGGQLALQDPTWSVAKYGGLGNFWFPHVYTPNQNPADVTGANAFGRWDYGPWFWPPQNPATLVSQPYQCSSAAYSAANPPAFPPLLCPGIPNPSGTPEGFMDTPVVNGTAYPSLTVDPAAYRFQILNAANDRALNLGLYVAEPLSIAVLDGGSGYTAAPPVTITPSNGFVLTSTVSSGVITTIQVTNVGAGYTVTPTVTIAGDGANAAATASIDAATGTVSGIKVTNPGTGYTFAVVTIDPPAGCTASCVTATAATTPVPTGSVLSVNILTAGTVFTTTPSVVIAPPTCVAGPNCTPATVVASVNTEVKMVDAAPHTASSTLKKCAQTTATGGAGLGIATVINGVPLNNTGLPANCYPSTWPTDGRDGGVPDPLTAGPPIIQIGTEGGLLPSPSVIPSTPMSYEYNRRSITVLNVFSHGLTFGPAERADVIVDFSQFAGKTLILYNDAPAPVPAFDPRVDYYTGDPDQTLGGGAPSTLPGYGPNTRTLVQIKVNATGTANGFNLGALQTALPNIFATTQEPIIVPEPAYPAANGGAAKASYVRIQDNFLTSTFIPGGNPITLTLQNAGAGYTVAPAITIAAPTTAGGTTATATTALAPASVASFALGNHGSGYTSAPAVTVAAPTTPGGTTASATTTLAPTSVRSITVSNRGLGYLLLSPPAITIAAPPCTINTTTCVRATATATVLLGRVYITLRVSGAGYTSVPAITIGAPPAGGTQAVAVAVLSPASVASINFVSGGSGYTAAPAVTIAAAPAGGTTATATATLAPRVVGLLTLTNPGNGYTAAPVVTIAPPPCTINGTTCIQAVAVAGPATPLLAKTIQELFTLDYGRMNATLGVELPFTNFLTQTTIPYGYVDPPTEMFKSGEIQLWKITHNGVDTHFIHFHLFTLQVINRVGWDGAIKPPDPNELSWKDTVRMNPLEDVIVALKPMTQVQKAATDLDVSNLPNSIRRLDVTQPVGASLTNEFTNVDPANQPATVTNDLTNFGYEYVWHCHILGHEENDMMRAMSLAVAPKAPSSVVAALSGLTRVNVTWADNSLNETGFTIQRAPATGGVPGVFATVGTVGANVKTFADTPARGASYAYRVIANNLVGYAKTYVAPAVGYPTTQADSAPSANSNIIAR